MKFVANGLPLPCIHLLLVALLPDAALAAQARSSMEVSVQVVRGDYSTAAAALIETARIRDSAGPTVNSDAECKAIGNTVIADGVWATCSWDPDSRVYLVTVQY
jgi:hypothetical protein